MQPWELRKKSHKADVDVEAQSQKAVSTLTPMWDAWWHMTDTVRAVCLLEEIEG